MNKLLFLLILSILFFNNTYSQYSYNHNYDDLNPAYLGLNDKPNINIEVFKYNQKYFDNGYLDLLLNIPLKKLYSGIGTFYSLRNSFFGTIQNFGLKYSFTYPLNKDLIASTGVKLSVNQYDYSYYENGYGSSDFINLFALDLGLWLKYKNLQFGISNENINNPSKELKLLNYSDILQQESNIKILFCYEVKLNSKIDLKNHLYIEHLNTFSDYKNVFFNNIFSINKTYLLGFTTETYFGFKNYIISPNLGVNLSDKFRFILTFDVLENFDSFYHSKRMSGIFTYKF